MNTVVGESRRNALFDRAKATRFEEHIKLHHLQALMKKFANHRPTRPDSNGRRWISRKDNSDDDAGNMTLEEFKDALEGVLNTRQWDEQIDLLFAKVDTSADGKVDWDEFCTYLLLQYRETSKSNKQEIPFVSEPKIKHILHNKQETTAGMCCVENPLRYITVSKEGIIGVFTPNLHLEKIYEVKDEVEESKGSKRRFRKWYIDAIYLQNVNKLAISSTGREIVFYDVSTGTYFQEFQLYGLPNIPTCLHYWYNVKDPGATSVLVFGDDMGYVHLLYFWQPLSGLFESLFMEDQDVQKIWMQDLEKVHSKCVKYFCLGKVHPEMVRRVRYVPDNDLVISSSSNGHTSVVLMDIEGKKKTYTFKMTKSVECFDFSKQLNLLITGNVDHNIRVWNPYVTEKPTAILIGHLMPIVDVVIHEAYEQLFSYCKEAVIKVWDLKEHTCIQTVMVHFACVHTGRIPEFGTCSLLLHPSNQLICSCADYIATLKLGKQVDQKNRVTTHSTQLCSALYEATFHQVITGADDSSIAVWDLETGTKTYVLNNAHGEEEITCMALDARGRRLMTASRDGVIKIWNVQNGHNIHHYEAACEAEVTGLIHFREKRAILAVGWSRKITLYEDSDPDTQHVKADNNWKGGQPHQDDILAAAHAANLLATASFDGELIVWSVDIEKIFLRLRKRQPIEVTQKLKETLNLLEVVEARSSASGSRPESSHHLDGSRPNSRHRQRHRPPDGYNQAPVDKLLFLGQRFHRQGQQEGAVLISSEAGWLHFWSVYGKNHKLGVFYASNSSDQEESVLAVCTNPSNNLLITGDTSGHLYVWNISSYCRRQSDKITTRRPPLEYDWKAHDSAVVSVDYINHEVRPFILTASLDYTARLWTLEGHYVGTFGQEEKWSLKNRATWKHPKNPWSDKEKEGKPEIEIDVLSDESSSDELYSEEEIEINLENIGAENNAETTLVQEVPVQPSNPAVNVSFVEPSKLMKGTHSEDEKSGQGEDQSESSENRLDRKRYRISPKSAPNEKRLPTEKKMSIYGDNFLFKQKKSLTFSNFGRGREKSLLGTCVEEDFERKTCSRKERRNRYGDINLSLTSRFGKICSPYQALATPDTKNTAFPDNLPLTGRMTKQGIHIRNEQDLRGLVLSPGMPALTDKTPVLPIIDIKTSSSLTSLK